MAAGAEIAPNLDPNQIAAIRSHLKEVLASPEFVGTERSRQLLLFLVEKTLAGDSAKLKEYAIGLDVFDRREDYDPRIDSTVRVQVKKLRDRLADYYGRPERQAGVRIELPKGGYVPAFVFPSTEAQKTLCRRLPAWIMGVALAAGLLAGVGATWLALRRPTIVFHQLTFRRGTLSTARFNRDGRTIVYAASWSGDAPELFSTSVASPEARPLGFHNTELLAVAPNGSLALLNRPFFLGPPSRGTLATAPATGTAAREVLDRVSDADWSADSSRLAVVTWQRYRRRLEYPAGRVLYETSLTGWIDHVRLSPAGDRIAFIDHRANLGDDEGWISVVDMAGKKRDLTGRWSSANGLSWSPSGREIWFTASDTGMNCTLRAVTLSGKQRIVASLPGRYALHDIAPDGRVLLASENTRMEMATGRAGELQHSDVSWLDGSLVRDMSADGRTVLFDEAGDGGGATSSIYIKRMDDTGAVRLADGFGMALSPDGKWVLGRQRHTMPPRLVLFPTGAGDERILPTGSIAYQEPGSWFPDGRRLLLVGGEPGHAARNYVYDIATGQATAVTPEGTAGYTLSPDGKRVAARAGGMLTLFDIERGTRQPIPGSAEIGMALRWSADGKYIFTSPGAMPLTIYRIAIAGGIPERWSQLMPADPTGVRTIDGFAISADGKQYAYSFMRQLSTLYLVDGLR